MRHQCAFFLKNTAGTYFNETAMECHTASSMLAPSKYVCKVSNNGGIEWGSAGAHYNSIRYPSIVSLTPQSGVEATSTYVAVLGTDMAVEGSQHTYCVLFDHAGSQIGSSLAERVNDTLVNCPVECPNHNTTTTYSLGISLNAVGQVHSSSMHTFWCDPKPTLLDLMPSFISMGERTSIRIHIAELQSANSVDCVFAGNNQITTIPGGCVTGGAIECISPEFDRPQRVTVSVSINNYTLSDKLQIEVLDPTLVYSVSPRTIFGGSDVLIKGSNLV